VLIIRCLPSLKIAGNSIPFHFCNYANVFRLLSLCINLMVMEKDENQTTKTTGNSSGTSPSSKHSRRQRNVHPPRRDHSRHLGGQGTCRRENESRQAPDMSAESKEKETGLDEDEETVPDRSSQEQRYHRRGRTEKRIIEESAYDPYCE
jgi:hypothetical protein